MPVQEQGTQPVEGLVDTHIMSAFAFPLRHVLILLLFLMVYEDGQGRQHHISRSVCGVDQELRRFQVVICGGFC